MTDSDAQPWLRNLAVNAGIHVLIASSLTVFLSGGSWEPQEFSISLGVNFMFSVSIGMVSWAMFGRLLPRLALHGLFAHLARAIAFAISVVAGVEIVLLILRLFGLTMQPGRIVVWRIAAVVTLAMIIISVGYDRLRVRARAVELREEQARRELLEAQLQNLRERLNPHFLFNSLNSLAGLIEEDPTRAVEALERLCDLLRRGLEASETRRSSLGEELSALRDYLHMEQLRFGERLRWTVDVAEALHNTRVPSLLLQPIVENAVKYAVAPRREGAAIEIVGRREGGRLSLEVRDDGPGSSDASGTQLGERTLRQRLALEYGESAQLVTGVRPEGGYRVQIDLPIEGSAS